MPEERLLAERLGVTRHVSVLGMKVRRIMAAFPMASPGCVEDWLLDLANSRGVTAVVRAGAPKSLGPAPTREEFSDAELVIALCSVANRDRPDWLRAAAELIGSGTADLPELERLVTLERAERVLGELSRQALRADPENPGWKAVHARFGSARPLRDGLVHWTRLAKKRGTHAAGRASFDRVRRFRS